MPHDVSLIVTLAAAFGLALTVGFLAERMKLPALAGYLLAGILMGPAIPGSAADVSIAAQQSEIDVMLLLFGVGLHSSLDDLLAGRRIALSRAVGQMGVATALGIGMAAWWGWSFGDALVFGLSLSYASTVMLLKAQESRSVLESMNGRIEIGWLVVEGLAVGLVLVLLPPLAGTLGGHVDPSASHARLSRTIGLTLLQGDAFFPRSCCAPTPRKKRRWSRATAVAASSTARRSSRRA